VADATGMVAGTRLTIADQGNTEQATVADGWQPLSGPATVTLTTALQFAHTPVFRPATAPAQPCDIAVTALPADVKQAVLLICKELVEVRGANALVMGRAGGIGGTVPAVAAATEQVPLAAQHVLDHYRRLL
jgi:hypothetical protein